MFVFVKDCDLYGLVTKKVFSYLGAIQLASSCMLDHVRGSTISDGQILGLEGHFCVSMCVYIVWFPQIDIVWVCPFCSIFESCLKVWTQQLQVRVCKTAPRMCTCPRCSVRSRSVKLDGGLLKVIMSKVPFSQDEHWAANCAASILYQILITSSCFF